jgi:hypothetical protein
MKPFLSSPNPKKYMQKNNTSWTAYNTERVQTGTVNEPVEELRLVTPEQKIEAGERIQALIDATKQHIGGND